MIKAAIIFVALAMAPLIARSKTVVIKAQEKIYFSQNASNDFVARSADREGTVQILKKGKLITTMHLPVARESRWGKLSVGPEGAKLEEIVDGRRLILNAGFLKATETGFKAYGSILEASYAEALLAGSLEEVGAILGNSHDIELSIKADDFLCQQKGSDLTCNRTFTVTADVSH
jgi:hypothetical protein